MKKSPVWTMSLTYLLAVTFIHTMPGLAETPDPLATNGNWLVTTATVVHVPLEGGFYGLRTDNGKRYDPGKSLPKQFRQPDLRVRVEGKVLAGVPTIRMWGKVIEIQKIEVISSGPPGKKVGADEGPSGDRPKPATASPK